MCWMIWNIYSYMVHTDLSVEMTMYVIPPMQKKVLLCLYAYLLSFRLKE